MNYNLKFTGRIFNNEELEMLQLKRVLGFRGEFDFKITKPIIGNI